MPSHRCRDSRSRWSDAPTPRRRGSPIGSPASFHRADHTSSPSPAGAGRIQAATICPRSAARTGLRPAPGRVFVQMFTPAAVQRPTRAVSVRRRLCRSNPRRPVRRGRRRCSVRRLGGVTRQPRLASARLAVPVNGADVDLRCHPGCRTSTMKPASVAASASYAPAELRLTWRGVTGEGRSGQRAATQLREHSPFGAGENS